MPSSRGRWWPSADRAARALLGALLGALLIACLLLLASSASAQAGRGTILLVAVAEEQGGWPEAETRFSAEVRSLGFKVVRATFQDPAAALGDGRLVPLLRKTGALAAVRFLRPSGDPSASAAVAVYVLDRTTGAAQTRSVGPERVDADLTAEAGALLASELVYSTLVGVRAAPPEPEPEPEPAPEPEPEPPPLPKATPRWAVRVGGLVAGGPGGAGATVAGLLGATWLMHEQLGADLQLDLPALSATVTDTGGRAELRLIGLRAHARFVAWPTSLVSLSVGLGGGLLHARITGEADPPYASRDDAGSVAVLSAMTQLDVDLGRGTRIFAGMRAALAVPELRVSFAGREVARVGRPLADASAGVELRW